MNGPAKEGSTYDGQPKTDAARYLSHDWAYISNRWDNRASRWDADLSDADSHLNRDGSYMRFFTILDSIVGKCKDTPSKTFIEIGCGTGVVLERYATRFKSLYGVDISRNMLAEAKKKKIPGALFVCDNAIEFLSRDITADFIVSRGILMSHFGKNNSRLFLKIAFDRLKPEGCVFLDMLNSDAKKIPYGKVAYSNFEIFFMAKNVGFKVVNVHYTSGYPLLYMEAYK